MFYGFSGYTEDLQSWEQARARLAEWEAQAVELKQQWARYQAERATASAECQKLNERYQRTVASRESYIPRYETDRDNCKQRQQSLDTLNARVEAWKQRHGIVGVFSTPPCLSSLQAQQIYKNTCQQQTEIRGIDGLQSGLGYAYLYADRDAGFRNAVDQKTNENIYCVLDDLPLCPTNLPNCEGLTPPGATPRPPVCSYPQQPPSISTLGPRPPTPGSRPTPPQPPPVLPPAVEPPPDTTTPIEETEDDGSSNFAMYGILALVLIGGGYVVYRTVK